MGTPRAGAAELQQEYGRLYEKAIEAGKAGVAPVVDDKHWGCWSALVRVNGNSRFGRWVVREKGWEKSHRGGVGLSISYPLIPRQVWQSENQKVWVARAFADVLKVAGIDVTVESWSD